MRERGEDVEEGEGVVGLLIGEERVEDGNLQDSLYLKCGSCKTGSAQAVTAPVFENRTDETKCEILSLKTMLTVPGTCCNVH